MLLTIALGIGAVLFYRRGHPDTASAGSTVTPNNSQPKDAATEMRAKAERGDPAEQFNLAVMYAKGQGMPKDDAQAQKWYRKAAEGGHAEAQFAMGFTYNFGGNVPKDAAEAVKWYRKAAEQGHVEAQYWLSNVYDQGGHGVPEDAAEGAKWLRMAAENGDHLAQSTLAFRYQIGQGVPVDHVQAYKWMLLSSAQGTVEERKRCESFASRLTPEQRAEGRWMAGEMKSIKTPAAR